MEVWAWAVGRLAPSTFPPVGAGGLAHLGSRRLPRMRSLADLITAAVHKEGVVQGVQTRALVRDSTYIERGLAPPLRSVTRARHSVAVHVRMSVDARAASRQQPWQRSGSLRGQTQRLSVLARAHQSWAQLGRQAREPASRGSGGPVRGAESVGGGRRRTCARRAWRSWPGKRPMEQLFRHTRFPACWCSRSAAPLSPARPCAASACAGLLRGSAPPKPTPPHAAAIGQAEQRPHARLERLRIEAAQRGLRCSQIAAAAAVWRGAEGNGRLSAPVHSCNAKQAG